MENIKQHLSRGSTLPRPNVNVGYRIMFFDCIHVQECARDCNIDIGGRGGSWVLLNSSLNSEEMHWGYHDMHGCYVRS